jgi:hypothetical protein
MHIKLIQEKLFKYPTALRLKMAILTVFCLSGLAFLHPFYLSITRIYHNPNNQSLEITIKLDTENLEQSLERLGTERLFLGEENEHPETDTYLQRYLQQRLQLRVNEQGVEALYLGKEVKLDVTWCYLEVEGVAQVSTLGITNRLLLEGNDPQTNVVQTEIHGQELGSLMNKDKTQDVLKYKE